MCEDFSLFIFFVLFEILSFNVIDDNVNNGTWLATKELSLKVKMIIVGKYSY